MPLQKDDLPHFTIQSELKSLLDKYGQVQVEKQLSSIGLTVPTQSKPNNPPISLLKAAHHYLTDEFSNFQNVAPSTQISYKSELRSFCKHFGVNIDSSISTNHLYGSFCHIPFYFASAFLSLCLDLYPSLLEVHITNLKMQLINSDSRSYQNPKNGIVSQGTAC